MNSAHTDVPALKRLLLGTAYMSLKRNTEAAYLQYRRDFLLGQPSLDKWCDVDPLELVGTPRGTNPEKATPKKTDSAGTPVPLPGYDARLLFFWSKVAGDFKAIEL